jgi:hypothetical protein
MMGWEEKLGSLWRVRWRNLVGYYTGMAGRKRLSIASN